MLVPFCHDATVTQIPHDIMMHGSVVSSSIAIKARSVFFRIVQPIIANDGSRLRSNHALDHSTVALNVARVVNIVEFKQGAVSANNGCRGAKLVHRVVLKFVVFACH